LSDTITKLLSEGHCTQKVKSQCCICDANWYKAGWALRLGVHQLTPAYSVKTYRAIYGAGDEVPGATTEDGAWAAADGCCSTVAVVGDDGDLLISSNGWVCCRCEEAHDCVRRQSILQVFNVCGRPHASNPHTHRPTCPSHEYV